MQRTMRVSSRRRSGFTLLEILIVVGIIALLAAFVVPQFMNTQKGAEIDIAKAAVAPGGGLAGQLELFRIHVGRFPKELKELIDKPDGDDGTKWRGPYIKSVSELKDPWGEELQYKFPGTLHGEENYDLWSKGPDKQDQTEDDIANWKKE